jgi:acyl carrier protein
MELESKIIKFLEDFLKEELEESIELSIDSKLFGGGGPLDSMALVNLVVDLEELIEDDYGKTITLADEKAMSRRTSPFSRVQNLIDYVQEQLNSDNDE